MEARLADLVKARLFAFGAGTQIFAWRVLVQTPPGGSGARVNGSAFGRPCEGAVVCAWGGDPTFTETAVMGPTGIFASETTLMAPHRHLRCRKPQSWAPQASSLSRAALMGPRRRLRCPEPHSWAPQGIFVVRNCSHGPLRVRMEVEVVWRFSR